VDWRPGTRWTKPLNEARIALITTAGFYLPGQRPFEQSFRHDDCSYREIPAQTPIGILQIGHTSDAFDHSGIEADRNLALPLAPARLISESGPEIAARLRADAVDAVVLVPV
jgi:D-proline reductase (dithiol) PrdB